MDVLDPAPDAKGQLLGPEDDRVRGLERALQALERVLAELAVVLDALRDGRVGELEQQGPAGAEHDRRLGVHAPDDGGRGEVVGHVVLTPWSGPHSC
jgi:hypothetical protein